MTRNYRKFDEDCKQGAVQLVIENGKQIAQVTRDLGISEGHAGQLVCQGAAGAEKGSVAGSGPACRAGVAASRRPRAADAA
jgi:transposase